MRADTQAGNAEMPAGPGDGRGHKAGGRQGQRTADGGREVFLAANFAKSATAAAGRIVLPAGRIVRADTQAGNAEMPAGPGDGRGHEAGGSQGQRTEESGRGP